MVGCLVCGVTVPVGTLCPVHARAVSTATDLTAEQIVATPVAAPRAWLVDQWGCTHPVGDSTIIGRSTSECQIAILHPSVSVLHAQFSAAPDGMQLRDRGSLNGTFVDDAALRSAVLRGGERLRFGSVSLFFATGPLPLVQDRGSAGRTVPSRSADLSFSAVLERGGRTIELLQRPGGGIARADSVAIEFARLEFALIAILAEARQRLSDPDLCFVSAPTLAEKLSFNSDYADGDNVRELVRRVRRKVRDAGLEDLIESRQRVGYRLAWQVAGRR